MGVFLVQNGRFLVVPKFIQFEFCLWYLNLAPQFDFLSPNIWILAPIFWFLAPKSRNHFFSRWIWGWGVPPWTSFGIVVGKKYSGHPSSNSTYWILNFLLTPSGGVGGWKADRVGSFPGTKREVLSSTKIGWFEFGVKYLNFGATYLSLGENLQTESFRRVLGRGGWVPRDLLEV